jgi:hypothetical protein
MGEMEGGYMIKRLIRDACILKPELMMILKHWLILNIVIGILSLIFIKGATGDEFINPKLLYLTFILAINAGIIIGTVARYFMEWRCEIQEAFDQYDLKNKYQFFKKRFE